LVVENIQQDFERAVTKAFWRKILARVRGANNDLLPFDLVRERLDWKGQHVLGLRQVPVEQITGSFGRYRDFDRAFLPTQKRTRGRWVSVDMAHYEEINLPPVDLYKMGLICEGRPPRLSPAARAQVRRCLVTEIDLDVLLTPGL
jgi:hypothetical protein